MNYYQYVLRISQESDSIQSDTDFSIVIPAIIEYAEQRIYRDLNLLNTTVRDNTVTLVPNSRDVPLPSTVTGSTQGFTTITGVSVLTPVGTTSSNGTRNPLTRSWQGIVDFLYPSDVSSGSGSVPSVFAVIGSTNPSGSASPTMIVGPSPGSSFAVEITGTFRPTALSSTNTTTYISAQLSDMFIAASMVYVADNMKQSGQPPHNPPLSQMWEARYMSFLQSAKQEDVRRRYSEHLSGQSANAPDRGAEK